MIHPITKQQDRQQGFVSIAIALTLVIVMALLTVGFAQLTRGEQQRALSKQLTAQAFYASESGINDAEQAIRNGTITTSNTKCTDTQQPVAPATVATLPNYKISNQTVAYSCVLVNLKPSALSWADVPPGQGRNTVFTTTAAITSLKVSWGSADPMKTRLVSNITLPPFLDFAHWNQPPVLTVSITPIGSGTFTRQNLIDNTFTVYLYPARATAVAADAVYGNSESVNQGKLLSGACVSTPGLAEPCSTTITGLPSSTGPFLVHIASNYASANFGLTSPGANFVNGQAVIDSTGKAQDVLKRQQIRYSLNGAGSGGSVGTATDAVAETGILCKRLLTDPTGTTTSPTTADCDPQQ